MIMLSIPLMNLKSNDVNRPKYLSELKRAGADRVFIFVSNLWNDAELEGSMRLLGENIAFYRENGLEVGVWITGFGHGGALNVPEENKASGFTHLVGLSSGGTADDSFCPLDESYSSGYMEFVRRICEQHPTLLMIDDDLRLSMHGAVDIGCACELHIAELSRRIGQRLDRAELSKQIFSGKPNELRDIWLDTMRDTLLGFGRRVRETIDRVDPTIRAGQCACITTWDLDGADAIELSRTLAGKTKPFLRLIGAPYWNNEHFSGTMNLGNIIELERMQLNWCRENAPDIEVFTEGDAYPRPRYRTPSCFVEGFDQALLADKRADGILKYMLDYNQTPLYETGYIDRHVRNSPLRDEIAAYFSGQDEGIYCFEPIHLDRERDCTLTGQAALLSEVVRPSIKLCTACSMPVSHEHDGHSPAIIFGESARHSSNRFDSMPLIVDAAAADILGSDICGMSFFEPISGNVTELFEASNEEIAVSSGGLCRVELCPEAEVLSWWIKGGARYPAVWRYINSRGQRIVGYAFIAMTAFSRRDPLCLSYERQRQLCEAVEWLQGTMPAAYLPKNTDLYILCKRDGDKLSVGLWNFGSDEILPSEVKLDRAYRTIEPIGQALMRLEGDKVALETAIQPFGFAGFEVKL